MERKVLTRYNHEDAIRHDQNLHGIERAARGKYAPVGDKVKDQLHVEKSTEPKDGYCVCDDLCVEHPSVRPCRLEIQDGLALNNGGGKAPADCHECHKNRHHRYDVLDGAGPEGNHCPSLVHERSLDNDD